MSQRLIGLICVFMFVWGLSTAVSAPLPTAAAVPDGLTPADWAQIQNQLPPQAVADWNQQAKLTASDAAVHDSLGISVAVSGDTAVVGAMQDDDAGSNSGSAYVFTRTDGVWSQQAKLTASDAAANDAFGHAVAVSGDTAVIGAWHDDDDGSDSGSAYVFTRTGTAWSQQAKLTASDAAADDYFGLYVAIEGDTVMIGALLDDHGAKVNSGSVYVFTRTGTVWSEQAKLTASDSAANDEFGRSVALNGDTAVIGASGDDNERGSAYVFTRSAGVWSQQAKLTASDSTANDNFGHAVALNGDTAVIGAFRDNYDGKIISGSAYIFTRNGGAWSQQAKLNASDATENDEFGRSVAVSGDMALIGTSGGRDVVYLFTRNGQEWHEQSKLTANDSVGNTLFGFSVAVSGDTAVIGAYLDSPENIAGSGSAYIFTLDENEYILTVGTAGEGSGQVQSDPAGSAFSPGSEVTLTAVGETGSIFTGWSGDVITTTNPLPLTMDSHKTITATFALDETPPPGFVIYLPLIVR